MAKDKSFHSAAIIVDATVDIADIVSPGGDFRSSAKRLYLLIEQALNRSDSENFPSSRLQFQAYIHLLPDYCPTPVVWKVIRHRELWTSSARLFFSLSYHCLGGLTLISMYFRLLQRDLAPSDISVVGLPIILLPIINLNACCRLRWKPGFTRAIKSRFSNG